MIFPMEVTMGLSLPGEFTTETLIDDLLHRRDELERYLKTVTALFNSAQEQKEHIERQFRNVCDEIFLVQQGQLSLGDIGSFPGHQSLASNLDDTPLDPAWEH